MGIYYGDKCVAGAGHVPDISIRDSDKHWIIDGKDTGVSSIGKDGKTAYEYAKEGGYTGTEEEFSQKLNIEYAPISIQQELNTFKNEYNDFADKISNIFENQYSYGFIDHMSISAPEKRIEYIGINKEYEPMSINFDNHIANCGSWNDFPVLVENKPYMVKSSGEADYPLNPDDYTKKLDGSPSDISNTTYEGGAFAKFPKVYVKRWVQGDDRYVKFSFIPLPGFHASGFIDSNNTEMDHVWIPMFYGSTVEGKMKCISGLKQDANTTIDSDYKAITAFSDRAAFFGGPIIETIRDMLYMLFKTTNIKEACGYGNASCYKTPIANSVINGGAFYGTKDACSLNKIFHSIVLGSYQGHQRDPYYLLVGGKFRVSVNYTYDLTGNTYFNTEIFAPSGKGTNNVYPSRCSVIEKFGSVPVEPYNGSKNTGYCDNVLSNIVFWKNIIASRFGYEGSINSSGYKCGISCLNLTGGIDGTNHSTSSSVLLRPPAKN